MAKNPPGQESFKKPKPTGKRGAKVKLTPEIQEKICRALSVGSYMETAAAFVGVHKSTLYEWLKLGAIATKGQYKEFSDAVDRALAQAEVKDLTHISNAAMGEPKFKTDDKGNKVIGLDGKPIQIGWVIQPNWNAAAWKLERRYPKSWGRKSRLDLASPDSNKVEHSHDLTAIIEKIYAPDDDDDPRNPNDDEDTETESNEE